jgi:hypothetical protein
LAGVFRRNSRSARPGDLRDALASRREAAVAQAKRPFQLGIYGPQAVGKMAVGMEVRRLTGAPLLHLHLLVDLLKPFFGFQTEPFQRLMTTFRLGILGESAEANRDLILTAVPRFSAPEVMQLIEDSAALATSVGGEALFVELEAPLAVRLERNRSELRRANKDLDWATDEALTTLDEAHITAAEAGVTLPDRHLVIDNTDLSAAAAAERIVEEFGLPRLNAP